MEDKENQKNEKKHADFQDSYRRSSNFNNSIKEKEEEFKIKKNGNLKMEDKKDKKELDESDKKRINDAVDGYENRKKGQDDEEE